MVVAEEQGVAIGSRRLERLRGELPARTGLVVHHHRVAQVFLEAVTDDAGDRVGAAAGREAHQDAGGGLRLGQADGADQAGRQQGTADQGGA